MLQLSHGTKTNTTDVPPAPSEAVETPAPQPQTQFITASQLHNDTTKLKPNYKRSASQIIIVVLLILAIVAILFFVKII